MSSKDTTRTWSSYKRTAKFSVGDALKPHLIDISKDVPHTPSDTFVVKEVLSTGLKKGTCYRVAGSDYIWPEARLRLAT